MALLEQTRETCRDSENQRLPIFQGSGLTLALQCPDRMSVRIDHETCPGASYHKDSEQINITQTHFPRRGATRYRRQDVEQAIPILLLITVALPYGLSPLVICAGLEYTTRKFVIDFL